MSTNRKEIELNENDGEVDKQVQPPARFSATSVNGTLPVSTNKKGSAARLIRTSLEFGHTDFYGTISMWPN